MNWNYPYPFYEYDPNQSYAQNSTVERVQNDNIQPLSAAAAIGKSQRISAEWCEDFFKAFEPEIMDTEFDKSETFDFYENPIFGKNENNIQEKQNVVVDKRVEPQITLNKPPKKKRIQKFKRHFTPGQPCKIQTTNSINKLLRNRSQSRSPITIPPTNFSPTGSSYENTYLNTPHPQYLSSRSPSLSPSLSPSDFCNSSASSSSYCPQSYCFSFSSENQQPQSNQLLCPSNQWDYYNNANNSQYYPPNNTISYGQSSYP